MQVENQEAHTGNKSGPSTPRLITAEAGGAQHFCAADVGASTRGRTAAGMLLTNSIHAKTAVFAIRTAGTRTEVGQSGKD
jgi:hypothetical protein